MRRHSNIEKNCRWHCVVVLVLHTLQSNVLRGVAWCCVLCVAPPACTQGPCVRMPCVSSMLIMVCLYILSSSVFLQMRVTLPLMHNHLVAIFLSPSSLSFCTPLPHLTIPAAQALTYSHSPSMYCPYILTCILSQLDGRSLLEYVDKTPSMVPPKPWGEEGEKGEELGQRIDHQRLFLSFFHGYKSTYNNKREGREKRSGSTITREVRDLSVSVLFLIFLFFVNMSLGVQEEWMCAQGRG